MTYSMMNKVVVAVVLVMSALCSMQVYALDKTKTNKNVNAEQLIATKVNVNKADAKTLSQQLKGVGEKRALAIVQYREKNGQFNSMDDLMAVKGIGKSVAAKNAGRIQFN